MDDSNGGVDYRGGATSKSVVNVGCDGTAERVTVHCCNGGVLSVHGHWHVAAADALPSGPPHAIAATHGPDVGQRTPAVAAAAPPTAAAADFPTDAAEDPPATAAAIRSAAAAVAPPAAATEYRVVVAVGRPVASRIVVAVIVIVVEAV